jgi:hypothetical protein
MGSILGNYVEIPLDLHMWCVTSCILCLSAGQQKRGSKGPLYRFERESLLIFRTAVTNSPAAAIFVPLRIIMIGYRKYHSLEAVLLNGTDG